MLSAFLNEPAVVLYTQSSENPRIPEIPYGNGAPAQHLAWATHRAGLVWHELRELLWGGEFKPLLHWEKNGIPQGKQIQEAENLRGGLKAWLTFGSFPQGRLGKYREIKREQQILVTREGGGCRGRGFKRLQNIFRPGKMNSGEGGRGRRPLRAT